MIERFGRNGLEDFDAGRSRRPVSTKPTLELTCYEPRAAYTGGFVHSMWADFLELTRTEMEIDYILRGCLIVGLEVKESPEKQIALRTTFLAGKHNDLIGKYKIFTVRFLRFPPITRSEEKEFGEMAQPELRFDLTAVLRTA